MKKLQCFVLFLFSVALIAGCGGPQRPPGLPKLYSCVLTFNFEDGSSVGERALATLVPEDAALNQWSIAGATDAAGTAIIRTRGDFAGAPAGKYKVTIQKTDYVETGEKDQYGDPVTEERSLINGKYGNASETPLSLEITGKAVKETFTVEK